MVTRCQVFTQEPPIELGPRSALFVPIAPHTIHSTTKDLQRRPDVAVWLPEEIPFDVVHINTINLTGAVELGRGGQGVVRRIYTADGTTLVLKEDLVHVDPAEYTKQLRIAGYAGRRALTD